MQKIEKLALGGQDRMNLVLTYLEEKPVSTIEIKHDSKSPLLRLKEVLSKKEELKKSLTGIGLKVKILEKEGIDKDGFDYKRFILLISRSKKRLKEFEKVLLEKDREKTGILLGFPKTATEAFSKGMKIGRLAKIMLDEKEWWQSLSEKEKEKLLEEGVLNFKNFKLSKGHFQEELNTIRRWQTKIKENAPNLFQEILREKPKLAMTQEEKKAREKKESEQALREIRKRVERIADRLGKPVEEGIKETVVMLNAFDFRTSASCEGHIKGEGIRGPYIIISPKRPRLKDWWDNEDLRKKVIRQRRFLKKRMVNLLKLFYRKRKIPCDVKLGLRGGAYSFRLVNHGSAILEVLEEKEREKKFRQYKKEIDEFTDFLKEKYPDYLFRRLRI